MKQRIQRYIDKVPPAISGQGGHNQTFSLACKLVLGFDLSPDEALPYMRYYNQKCQPAWTEKELRHKVSDANKKNDERGYLNRKQKCKLRRTPRYSLPDARSFRF